MLKNSYNKANKLFFTILVNFLKDIMQKLYYILFTLILPFSLYSVTKKSNAQKKHFQNSVKKRTRKIKRKKTLEREAKVQDYNSPSQLLGSDLCNFDSFFEQENIEDYNNTDDLLTSNLCKFDQLSEVKSDVEISKINIKWHQASSTYQNGKMVNFLIDFLDGDIIMKKSENGISLVNKEVFRKLPDSLQLNFALTVKRYMSVKKNNSMESFFSYLNKNLA